MYRQQPLGLLVRLDPDAARKRIVATLRKHDRLLGKSAAALGCSIDTLRRWIRQLDVPATELRQRGECARYAGGRPRKIAA